MLGLFTVAYLAMMLIEGSQLSAPCKGRRSRSKLSNNWMRKYAADSHSIYLDYYSAMVDDKRFSQG